MSVIGGQSSQQPGHFFAATKFPTPDPVNEITCHVGIKTLDVHLNDDGITLVCVCIVVNRFPLHSPVKVLRNRKSSQEVSRDLALHSFDLCGGVVNQPFLIADDALKWLDVFPTVEGGVVGFGIRRKLLQIRTILTEPPREIV